VREASNVLSAQQQASMEKKVLEYVNQNRKSKNLHTLVSSEPLVQLAREHSLQMQRTNKIDHQGFSRRVSKARNQYPRTYVAENVGVNLGNSMSEKSIVDSWISSAAHRDNILGNYRYTGVGITQNAQGKIFFTQLFVSP
jgi:uncharacterized protein YkwD